MMSGNKTWHTSVSLLFIAALAVNAKEFKWPEYNQQCQDDAGSPYGDDEELFGNGFYHDGSRAVPILKNSGECASKMKKACDLRPTKKTAYLEGPLDCGNKGWYCRIMPHPNQKEWPGLNLIGDVNFGHCNSTDGFSDDGYDGDGHCHGSSVDSTYYWWIRDHWHRAYNGNLRCCCGWFEGSSPQALYDRRIANRCDYRREVLKTENLDNCRDANEDHGMGFDNIGCNKNKYEGQLGKPIPENDELCWEINKFGFDEDGSDTTLSPALSSPPPSKSPVSGGDGDGDGDGDEDEDEDEDEDDDDEIECEERKKTKFLFKLKKKNGEVVGAKEKSCKWLENKKKKKGKKHKKQVKKICKRKNGYENEEDDMYLEPAREVCMITCETCDLDEGEDERI